MNKRLHEDSVCHVGKTERQQKVKLVKELEDTFLKKVCQTICFEKYQIPIWGL